MDDPELHRFKSDIHLVRFAIERYGYLRNPDKSTRSVHVLGHPTTGDKIVVRRWSDDHWTYFSLRDDEDKGTVVDFVLRRHPGATFGEARKELRGWLGLAPPDSAAWRELARPAAPYDPCAVARAFGQARPATRSFYLESRGLRPETLADERFAGSWRVGRHESVLFPHRDQDGDLTGFEIKGRSVTLFSPSGMKTAWQSQARPDDQALVVTESAIDAFSHFQLFAPKSARCRYASLGGAPSPHQLHVLSQLFERLPPGARVVGAVDRDAAGARFAAQLEERARAIPGLVFQRHSPSRDKDWNDALRATLERAAHRSLSGPSR